MTNISPIDTIDISYLHCQYEGCSPYDKMTELMVPNVSGSKQSFNVINPGFVAQLHELE